MRYLVREYLAYYNEERPHQAKGNRPLSGSGSLGSPGVPVGRTVVCQARLGGLLKHYRWRGA